MTIKDRARIIAQGSYLPEKVLSNADLAKIVDTNDEWITSRTGMKERRIAADDEFTSTMAIHAAKAALKRANMPVEEIALIVVATATPDYPFPSTATLVQQGLGAKNAAAMDISAACSGFIYGLSLCKAYIESGAYENVLLIASEKLSTITDYTDRGTCILFGDGASAAILSNKGAGLAIRDVTLGADGNQWELLHIPSGGSRSPASKETVEKGGHYMVMNGKEVFKHAVRSMESVSRQSLERAGLSEADISWVVPHQANIRIIDALAKRFNIDPDRVYKTIHKYGNTSASAVAIALNELIDEHPVNEGENILLTAFGGGFTFGSSILTKVSD